MTTSTKSNGVVWIAAWVIAVAAMALNAHVQGAEESFRAILLIGGIGGAFGLIWLTGQAVIRRGRTDDDTVTGQLSRFRVEPGDTLVIKSASPLSREATRVLESRVEARLPHGCRALVLYDLDVIAAVTRGSGVKLAQREDAEPTPEQVDRIGRAIMSRVLDAGRHR